MALAFVLGSWLHTLLRSSPHKQADSAMFALSVSGLGNSTHTRVGLQSQWTDISSENQLVVWNWPVECFLLCALRHSSPVRKAGTTLRIAYRRVLVQGVGYMGVNKGLKPFWTNYKWKSLGWNASKLPTGVWAAQPDTWVQNCTSAIWIVWLASVGEYKILPRFLLSTAAWSGWKLFRQLLCFTNWVPLAIRGLLGLQ